MLAHQDVAELPEVHRRLRSQTRTIEGGGDPQPSTACTSASYTGMKPGASATIGAGARLGRSLGAGWEPHCRGSDLHPLLEGEGAPLELGDPLGDLDFDPPQGLGSVLNWGILREGKS